MTADFFKNINLGYIFAFIVILFFGIAVANFVAERSTNDVIVNYRRLNI